MDKYEALKKYFGYDSFREGQEEIIDSILNKENVLCLMPTGGGKSLCFQIPGLIMPGLTIVITPLISLMIDQVNHLKEKNITASFLNSSSSYKEIQDTYNMIKENKLKFLYVAPEKFNNKEFIDIIIKANVSQITLDEAHCISIYGHDFRKDYSLIGDKILNNFKNAVISCFTATASQSVINDIKESTKLNYKIFKFDFDRKNLYYETINSKDEFKDLITVLNNNKDVLTIVYCLTRRQTEDIYNKLNNLNYKVTMYHGGLDSEIKKNNASLFSLDKKNIMVATSSYGTGIDIPNIRIIINLGFPMSIEDLAQQQGRAGRDNLYSKCYMIYNTKDLYYNNYFINNTDLEDEVQNRILKRIKREKLREVVEYASTKRCLHEYLVSHFGQLYMSYCNKCSNCLKNKKQIDMIFEARLVIETIRLTKERYGSNVISKIITGSKDKYIKDNKLYKIKTYNKTIRNINQIKNLIANLISDNYIYRTYDEYPILKINEYSDNIFSLNDYKVIE